MLVYNSDGRTEPSDGSSIPGVDGGALGIAGLVLAVLLCSSVARAQTVDTRLWTTNGTVYAVARDAGTLYIGGDFTQVGAATGGCVSFDVSTGVGRKPYPMVAGSVSALAPDGPAVGT